MGITPPPSALTALAVILVSSCILMHCDCLCRKQGEGGAVIVPGCLVMGLAWPCRVRRIGLLANSHAFVLPGA